jgi:hypothetical protein
MFPLVGRSFSFHQITDFNHVIFEGTFTEILENDEVRIERCLFASQEYTELLITHVILTRLGSTGLILNIDCSN